jgi:phosphoglucomutase
VREKDGLWAVLLWLNILAVRREPVAGILADHWRRFGRNYYSRHDYEAIPVETANRMMTGLRARMEDLPGQTVEGLLVRAADEFSYHDPVDGSVSRNQGVRVIFEGGARAVFRLSGTGTEGATLRIYLESPETDPDALFGDTQEMLAPVIAAARTLCDIGQTGRDAPDVIT